MNYCHDVMRFMMHPLPPFPKPLMTSTCIRCRTPHPIGKGAKKHRCPRGARR